LDEVKENSVEIVREGILICYVEDNKRGMRRCIGYGGCALKLALSLAIPLTEFRFYFLKFQVGQNLRKFKSSKLPVWTILIIGFHFTFNIK